MEVRRLSFYETLARHYDEIFPLKEPQETFLRNFLQQHGVQSVLDVGCATGNHTLAMASWGLQCVGLDLSPAMIEIARRKLAPDMLGQTSNSVVRSERTSQGGQANFLVGNMLQLDQLPDTYDALVCLGNTLVHMTEESSLREVLLQFRHKAKNLLVQIVNYDRVLDQEEWRLPEIRTRNLEFYRRYSWRPDGLLEFTAEIKLAHNGHVVADSTLLRPLRRDDLSNLLTYAGWTVGPSFGSWGGVPWSPKSPATIMSAV